MGFADGDTLFVCYRSKNDLAKQLTELKGELLALRVQKIAGGSASKLTKMCVVLYILYKLFSNSYEYAVTPSASPLRVS